MYIAIDIGGTFVKFALMSAEGSLNKNSKYPTPSRYEDFLDMVISFASPFATIKGIAISSPGTVYPDGRIGGTSAVPFIHEGNFKEKLEKALNLPVTVENDANCAALAEVWKGAAKELNDIALIIVGTGIGGAIIKDRKLHKGKHLLGGEIGYTLLSVDTERMSLSQCSLLASTGAMIRSYAEKKKVPVEQVNGEFVFKRAEEDDPIACEVIDRFYFTLAAMVYNIHYIYNPDAILIGGAISERPDILVGIRRALGTIFNKLSDLEHVIPEVNVCQFHNHANLLGALYAHQQLVNE